jgi:hypothetical protein
VYTQLGDGRASEDRVAGRAQDVLIERGKRGEVLATRRAQVQQSGALGSLTGFVHAVELQKAKGADPELRQS